TPENTRTSVISNPATWFILQVLPPRKPSAADGLPDSSLATDTVPRAIWNGTDITSISLSTAISTSGTRDSDPSAAAGPNCTHVWAIRDQASAARLHGGSTASINTLPAGCP